MYNCILTSTLHSLVPQKRNLKYLIVGLSVITVMSLVFGIVATIKVAQISTNNNNNGDGDTGSMSQQINSDASGGAIRNDNQAQPTNGGKNGASGNDGNQSENTVVNYASAIEGVNAVLEASKDAIDNSLFLYETPTGGWEPSSVYRYEGLVGGLKVMYEDGVAGKYFYMGDEGNNGYVYGVVNVAAFLAQSMKETIRYDACDENSWDLVNGKYPLSNSCGQLGQSYQDNHCSAEEAHMECAVDLDMEITAVTHAKWWGAPAPLKCGPKSTFPFTGFWDYLEECNQPWAGKTCSDYQGQIGGGENNDAPYANTAGRTDVEGCCWWGRGVIQTSGICNFGKLNYYLGKRAADEGRESRYPSIDFCKDPEAICASRQYTELKWVAGMFYWMESVQTYDSAGWNYMDELHKFVDEGMTNMDFIDSVSGIVNRGCHNPPCGTGELHSREERQENFVKVLAEFEDAAGSLV